MRNVITLTWAALLMSITGGSALADDSAACLKAQKLVGADAIHMSENECSRALEAAEEERWQLWLDMALAHETSEDYASSMHYYNLFLGSSGNRDSLSQAWTEVRGQTQDSVGRIEKMLMATHSKVTIKTDPPEAMASIRGARDGQTDMTTPFTTYLPPGDHVVDVFHKAADVKLNRTIAVASAGEAMTIDIPLKTPTKVAAPAPSSTGGAMHGGMMHMKDDGGPDATRTTGHVMIGLGIAAASVAGLFYLQGDGLDSGVNCDQCSNFTSTLAARQQERADEWFDRALFTGIGGGVLLLGGIILTAVGDNEPASVSEGPILRSLQPALLNGDTPGMAASLTF